MRLRLLVIIVTCLVAASCDWFVGEEGSTQIGLVDGEPLVFPMNIDVTDTDVPELARGWFDGGWNGEPFSWQCYVSNSTFGLPTPPPVPIGDLSVPVTAGDGDFLQITIEWETQSPDVGEFCSSDPSFVPASSGDESRFAPQQGRCQIGVLVNGVPQDGWPERYGRGRGLEVLVGPLEPGDVAVEVASLDCSGMQWNDGYLSLVVEHIEVSSQGSRPWTGTTIATPTTSFVTGTTSTTLPPGVPECPPAPSNPVLRAEAVFTLWRLAGLPTPSSPHPFVDVPAGEFYADAVSWAYEDGIVTGTTPTTFSPGDITNRAQYALFLWRDAGSPLPGSPHPFTDVPPVFEQAVSWAYENGIMEGTSPTTFDPDGAIFHSTAEVAVHALLGNPDPPTFVYFDCPV